MYKKYLYLLFREAIFAENQLTTFSIFLPATFAYLLALELNIST